MTRGIAQNKVDAGTDRLSFGDAKDSSQRGRIAQNSKRRVWMIVKDRKRSRGDRLYVLE